MQEPDVSDHSRRSYAEQNCVIVTWIATMEWGMQPLQMKQHLEVAAAVAARLAPLRH